MATILIVDDEADCRKPLAALLKCEGYEITEARDGLEGLQRLSEQHHDLVLLDMLMPGVDGVTMLQAMRRREDCAKLPVLLVTGVHEPELLNKARTIGVQEYIFKGDTPFSKMIELIKRHLGEHHVPKRRGRKPKNPRPETPPGAPPGVAGKQQKYPLPARFLQYQMDFAETED
jgi:two-component system chemotaxis response regulator CheY